MFVFWAHYYKVVFIFYCITLNTYSQTVYNCYNTSSVKCNTEYREGQTYGRPCVILTINALKTLIHLYTKLSQTCTQLH